MQKTRKLIALSFLATVAAAANVAAQDTGRVGTAREVAKEGTRDAQGATKKVDDRAVVGEMTAGIKKHRQTLARIDRLAEVYGKQGDRAKVAEVAKLRERENNRFTTSMATYKRQLGEGKYNTVMASLATRRTNQAKGVREAGTEKATGAENAERRANAAKQKKIQEGKQNAERRENALGQKKIEAGKQNADRRANAVEQKKIEEGKQNAERRANAVEQKKIEAGKQNADRRENALEKKGEVKDGRRLDDLEKKVEKGDIKVERRQIGARKKAGEVPKDLDKAKQRIKKKKVDGEVKGAGGGRKKRDGGGGN